MKVKVNREFWVMLKQQFKLWQMGALPGMAIISCVAIARLTGNLQTLESMAFDTFLRWRPTEAQDTRIVIVGINEADIRAVGKYPIPDQNLAQLLKAVQRYQPRVIGLDLFRDVATDANRVELAQILKRTPELIGIEAVLSSNTSHQVKAPPELPPDRVGLVDTLLDSDGKLRRSLLASKLESGALGYGLSVRLAMAYLRPNGIWLNHGERASYPMQFGSVKLPRFHPNDGGYVRAAAGGNQILINYRSHSNPFPTVSMTEVLSGKIAPDLMRDRIVLIGVTASNSSNDTFLTSATKGTLLTNALGNADTNQYQLLYGVEHHAHVTSQIISAVLDRRSLLRTWLDGWEYIWIGAWGMGGIALGLLLQSPWKTLITIAISSAGVVGICYGLIILSWWVPVVPTLLALLGAGLTTSFFDRHSRTMLEQRERILKQTYDAVHNGPLQTLAAMLRSLGDDPIPADRLRVRLYALNQELRSVYDSMYVAAQADERHLKVPLPNLLYQVYESTLQRDLPGFATIQLFIPPDFSILEACLLTTDQKHGLCLFLQEALCNVGNHAVSAKRLEVTCTLEHDCYTLRILDDGLGSFSSGTSPRNGRGTEQAKELALSLNGRFQRRSHSPHGTICEMIWSTQRHRLPLQKMVSSLWKRTRSAH